MKKYIFIALLGTLSATTLFAQHDHSGHQQNPPATSDKVPQNAATSEGTQNQFAQLLSFYYNIKNALVAGDATVAASSSGEFLKIVNSIDYKVLSENNVNILAKDAGRISETKDLAKQRQLFATLSSNMATVAKTLKLTVQPVYIQYCPMKKASWLSAEKEIRNPYFGNAMLTCGEITETL